MSEAREKSRPQVLQTERGLETLLVPAMDGLELFSGFKVLVEAGYDDEDVVAAVAKAGP